MARKLKTYTTSAGFFDLAVAAPSMKAALQAWGSTRNLFHDGFARQSEDPAIVRATMAKPGVVLRRAVGTTAAFSEQAALPRDLGPGKPPASAKRPRKVAPAAVKVADDEAERQAARAFERERRRRERQEQQEAAARERDRERRERAVAAAEAALDDARQRYEAEREEIESARLALEKKGQAVEARWSRKKASLEEALRRARTQ